MVPEVWASALHDQTWFHHPSPYKKSAHVNSALDRFWWRVDRHDVACPGGNLPLVSLVFVWIDVYQHLLLLLDKLDVFISNFQLDDVYLPSTLDGSNP